MGPPTACQPHLMSTCQPQPTESLRSCQTDPGFSTGFGIGSPNHQWLEIPWFLGGAGMIFEQASFLTIPGSSTFLSRPVVDVCWSVDVLLFSLIFVACHAFEITACVFFVAFPDSLLCYSQDISGCFIQAKSCDDLQCRFSGETGSTNKHHPNLAIYLKGCFNPYDLYVWYIYPHLLQIGIGWLFAK